MQFSRFLATVVLAVSLAACGGGGGGTVDVVVLPPIPPTAPPTLGVEVQRSGNVSPALPGSRAVTIYSFKVTAQPPRPIAKMRFTSTAFLPSFVDHRFGFRLLKNGQDFTQATGTNSYLGLSFYDLEIGFPNGWVPQAGNDLYSVVIDIDAAAPLGDIRLGLESYTYVDNSGVLVGNLFGDVIRVTAVGGYSVPAILSTSPELQLGPIGSMATVTATIICPAGNVSLCQPLTLGVLVFGGSVPEFSLVGGPQVMMERPPGSSLEYRIAPSLDMMPGTSVVFSVRSIITSPQGAVIRLSSMPTNIGTTRLVNPTTPNTCSSFAPPVCKG